MFSGSATAPTPSLSLNFETIEAFQGLGKSTPWPHCSSRQRAAARRDACTHSKALSKGNGKSCKIPCRPASQIQCLAVPEQTVAAAFAYATRECVSCTPAGSPQSSEDFLRASTLRSTIFKQNHPTDKSKTTQASVSNVALWPGTLLPLAALPRRSSGMRVRCKPNCKTVSDQRTVSSNRAAPARTLPAPRGCGTWHAEANADLSGSYFKRPQDRTHMPRSPRA